MASFKDLKADFRYGIAEAGGLALKPEVVPQSLTNLTVTQGGSYARTLRGTDPLTGGTYTARIPKLGIRPTIHRAGKAGFVAYKDVPASFRNEIIAVYDTMYQEELAKLGPPLHFATTTQAAIVGLEPALIQIRSTEAVARVQARPDYKARFDVVLFKRMEHYKGLIRDKAVEILNHYVYENDNAVDRLAASAFMSLSRFGKGSAKRGAGATLPRSTLHTLQTRYGGESPATLQSLTTLWQGEFARSGRGKYTRDYTRQWARTTLRPPPYFRSGKLYQALMQGIKSVTLHGAAGLSVGYDETVFAPNDPYWVYVEKGHRVVMPRPAGKGQRGYVMEETGGTVEPKPILDELYHWMRTQLDSIIAADIQEAFRGIGPHAIEIIRESALGYGETKRRFTDYAISAPTAAGLVKEYHPARFIRKSGRG